MSEVFFGALVTGVGIGIGFWLIVIPSVLLIVQKRNKPEPELYDGKTFNQKAVDCWMLNIALNRRICLSQEDNCDTFKIIVDHLDQIDTTLIQLNTSVKSLTGTIVQEFSLPIIDGQYELSDEMQSDLTQCQNSIQEHESKNDETSIPWRNY